MFSWLAINKNKIPVVDFTLTDALFGKFDIVEDVIVINTFFCLQSLISTGVSLITQNHLFKAKLNVTLKHIILDC